MDYKQMSLGPLQTNCYILWNSKNEAIVIDPGEEGRRIMRFINEKKLTPLAILLTHAHFDHIGAVDYLRHHYRIPLFIHENEGDWLSDPALNGSKSFMNDHVKINPANSFITKEGLLTIGSFEFEIFETPGHSPGSVSYYIKDSHLVFSGDALFQGSIGRTDLTGGNHQQLLNSIHNKLLSLPEETIVLSGHGPKTTIQAEMDYNPFLNGF